MCYIIGIFLKGFVEDLWGSFWSENAFWSENSVLDFFRKIFLVTEFFGQNFLVRIFIFRFRCCFFVDCVLYYRDSFWRVLLKTFWIFFEVKVFFSVLDFLVRIFFLFFCRLCDIFGSFWRVLWKTFGVLFEVKMLFEVKIQFWIFFGKFFWWQNFLVRIFWSEFLFFVFVVVFL